MASSILNRLGNATARRLAEETFERGIREGLAAGEDENLISRRILKAFFAPTSTLATAISAIPGARFAPHIGLSVAAEYLSGYADTLLPGDNRQIVKLVRQTLKTAAPVLEGVGDATADVLETQINQAVDDARSPSSVASADRRGKLDQSVFIWLIGKECILIMPVRSADGSIQRDDLGDPVPSNLRGSRLELWLSERFTKKGNRKVKGKDGKERDVPVERERRVLAGEMEFADALQYEGVVEGLNATEAEELKRLFAPKPSWESRISPDVDHVLSWLVDVLSLVALHLSALERQEIEDLVQKMKTQKPEPDWVNRRLGRFREETDRFPLHGSLIYNEAQLERIRTLLSRIRDEIDITLEGEQSLLTKTRKGLQAAPDILRQVGDLLSHTAPWVARGLLWWRNAIIAAILFLLLGILLPVTKVGVPWFTLTTLLIAVAGGILGFAITWPFPLVQKIYDYLPKVISGYSVDSINSLGRRVASFFLCMGAGVLPLTIWFEFPILVRAGIVAFGGLFPIGILFALREAGYPDVAQRLVKRSLLVANFVFGTLAVATMTLVGFVASYTGNFMTGPQFVKWAFDGSVAGAGHAGSWLARLHWWHYLGFGALALFLLFIVAILFGKSKEGSGGGDRAMTLASILMGGGAFLAVLFLGGWLILAGLHEIGSWFGGSASATTTVMTQTKDNGPWFDRTALCANQNTTFEQRQILKCP